MTDYARVKRNIAKMIAAGAPESEIDQYVASEGVTPAQLRGQSAPKPKAPTAPKPRPPITAYADTPLQRSARAAPRPTGVMPVQPELLAPMRALGATTTAPAPKPRAPRAQPAPVPMEPGVASIFGGAVTPYATPEFDPMTVKREDRSPLQNSGLLDRSLFSAKRSALRIGSGGARVIAAGMNAIDDGFGDALTARADKVDQFISRPVEGETTLDALAANPTLGSLGSFIAEQGTGSLVDMAGLATSAGIVPYFASMAGNIGQDRAENNSTGAATLTDIIKAAPAAALSTAAERLGTKFIGGAGGGGNLMTRLGASAVTEGATEGVQSLAEYTGGTLGTERGFDLNEGLSQAGQGAVTGGILGPVLRTGLTEVPTAIGTGIGMARDAMAEPVVEQPKPVVAKAPVAMREETRRVTIPTGGKIDVRMELVSADDITQAEGSKQNRDRDRAASEAQIMAKATDAALRASVVGSWASLESECRTDDYELFAADGRYSAASMAEGSWSVSNGQISTLIDREPEDMGGDWKSLSKPRELRRKFTIDGHDRISIWYAGERFRMMRCDDGSYHTWNG